MELDSTKAQELLEKLDIGQIPAHVAIIMDGNGRWASMKNRPRVWGHRQGAHRVRTVVELSGKLGVRVLTLFAFSEENWGRPTFEVSSLMSLLDNYIVAERKQLKEKNVRFRTIGDIARLPQKTQAHIRETEEFLSQNTGLILNIALSYGSQQEIARACRKVVSKIASGVLKPDQINPAIIAQHLDTAGLPDPDLLVRTSGEQRLSNFLLWQSAYTELYFCDSHWPDFDEVAYLNALIDFQKRHRRFGLAEVEAYPAESFCEGDEGVRC